MTAVVFRRDAAVPSTLAKGVISLADTGSVQVAVGSQQSTFTVCPTVLYAGTDEHLWDHRHQ